MNDKYFLDTNIIVYSFDKTAHRKQGIARELIRTALMLHQGCISYQVIQEFFNVATRKFVSPLSTRDCQVYLHDILAPLCEVFPSFEFYSQALQVAARWKYAFYDSLIIAAALEAGCKTLYSEDLQDRQEINGLVIANPFRTQS
ncbi:MAG: PIN domain-containing protein [Desulfobacterales bacterium]|nr:PIN domain-containing protein [Desulfobacterales bacterium]